MNQISEETLLKVIDDSKTLCISAALAKDKRLSDLGLDSLDLISLSMAFEDACQMSISTQKLTPQSTLEDLIKNLVSTS